MRVVKSKRKLLRWQRYIASTNSIATNSRLCKYHKGYSQAYANVMFARKWVPNGIRYPYTPLWGNVNS